MSTSLQPVADAVMRLAKRQGFVLPRDVRGELRLVGLPESQWKEVVALTKAVLVYRNGRYCHKEAFTPRLQKEQAQQQAIQKAVRRLIKQQRRRHQEDERRGQARVDFVQPVKVRAEDGREQTLMTRDLSPTGIRLLGTTRLLGQKVQIEFGGDGDEPLCRLIARILWTCAIGDDLFENGGNFLDVAQP